MIVCVSKRKHEKKTSRSLYLAKNKPDNVLGTGRCRERAIVFKVVSSTFPQLLCAYVPEINFSVFVRPTFIFSQVS